MTMDAYDAPFYIGDALSYAFYEPCEFEWRSVADRIRDVHRCCAGIDYGLHNLIKKLPLGPRCVLRGKFYVAAFGLCVFHCRDRKLQYLAFRLLQFIFHM